MTPADELLALLDEATAIVAGHSSMNMFCGFDSGAEFAAELSFLRARMARQDRTALRELVGIFAPTGAWDDGVGESGMALANRVMELLDNLGWNRLRA
jgi:hypothetical protein